MSAQNISFDRQIENVRNLTTPPYSYELRSYEVAQVTATTLSVTRSYSHPGMKVEWHECLFVGPRGGIKTIYKNLY